MRSNITDNKAGVPSAVLHQLNRLQPEIVFLLTHAPKFGKASLEVHFIDGEIRRVIRHREESVVLTKGEN